MEEDKYLCRHDWKDMYGGDGVDQKNPYKAFQAFYCTKCLDIRVKSWSRLRYKLDANYLLWFNDGAEDEDSNNLTAGVQ